MTPLEAMKQALEALERNAGEFRVEGAKNILREALAQPEQEPVAFRFRHESGTYDYYDTSMEWMPAGECDYLYTHPAPIPEGWQLVPIEPTEKMIDAACQSGISVNGRPIWKHTIDKQAIWKWKTMLAAAPKPEE